MIRSMEETIPFIKGFSEYIKAMNEKAPAWVNALRKESLDQFARLGVPTVKDEEWKYTNIASATERKYHIPTEKKKIDNKALNRFLTKEEISLVFVNGIFAPEYSNLKNLPKGLKVATLQEANQTNRQDIEAIHKKFSDHRVTSFVDLNNALSQDGAFIKIEDKAVIDRLVHIVHLTTENEILTVPRTLIIAGKFSEATVLESHLSFDEGLIYLTNSLTDMIVEENATFNYCQAQSESRKSYYIGATRIWQEANSNFHNFLLTVGGAITRNNLDVVLDGEGANSTLNGLYTMDDHQHVDNHTAVDHRVPNCISNQLYKGILNGASRGVFNGKIFVRPIAQKTNSYQLNKNLLLGKDARIDTKPQLEIGADDVKCTHGATIGQLNEDEVFYLRSRCISRQDAILMLSHGFVDDVLNRIPSKAIHAIMDMLLEPTFSNLQNR